MHKLSPASQTSDFLDHHALSHSLVEHCRPMVVVTDAEADETGKHPLLKCLNCTAVRLCMWQWSSLCFGGTQKAKDIKKKERAQMSIWWWTKKSDPRGQRADPSPSIIRLHTHTHSYIQAHIHADAGINSYTTVIFGVKIFFIKF